MIGALAALLVAAGMVTGGKPACKPSYPKAERVLTVAGSSSVQPVAEAWARGFEAINPGTRIRVQTGGSTAGIRAVTDGAADIGTVSRKLDPNETGRLRAVTVARDVLAVAVHPSNRLENVSTDQLRDIFEGRITDWSALGGAPGRITLVAREAGSGTREAFETLVLGGRPTDYRAVVQNAPGAVRRAVASDPAAIGYLSLAVADPSIKTLRVDGTEPGLHEIQSGRYPLTRDFLLVTGPVPHDGAQEFIRFILSPDGQALAAREGLIPIR